MELYNFSLFGLGLWTPRNTHNDGSPLPPYWPIYAWHGVKTEYLLMCINNHKIWLRNADAPFVVCPLEKEPLCVSVAAKY